MTTTATLSVARLRGLLQRQAEAEAQEHRLRQQVGTLLRAVRRDLGLTLREAAALAGCAASTVCNLERGVAWSATIASLLARVYAERAR